MEIINRMKRKSFISDDFPQYHLDVLESINRVKSFSGRIVVDIGGSNIPAEVMRLFGVKKFVCLDPISKWYGLHNEKTPLKYNSKHVCKLKDFAMNFRKEYSFVLDEDIENLNDEVCGLFDVALSISTFEHVTSLDETLKIIYNMLKKDGILYSQYEPIFSCAVGHHVWINESFNFNNMPEIDHMHLLYNKEEAKLFLEGIDRFDHFIKEKIIEKAYDSKIINRFMLRDHVTSFQNSCFNKYDIEYFYTQQVSDEKLEILNKKYGCMRYDVRGIKYLGYK